MAVTNAFWNLKVDQLFPEATLDCSGGHTSSMPCSYVHKMDATESIRDPGYQLCDAGKLLHVNQRFCELAAMAAARTPRGSAMARSEIALASLKVNVNVIANSKILPFT